MKWYVVNLVVECRVARAPSDLWDEQVVVLRARNDEDAYRKGIKLCKKQNHSYKNSSGDTVTWKFSGVAELQELGSEEITSGTEIYSRLTRGEKPRIPKKRDLIAFWSKRNLHKTAKELLS